MTEMYFSLKKVFAVFCSLLLITVSVVAQKPKTPKKEPEYYFLVAENEYFYYTSDHGWPDSEGISKRGIVYEPAQQKIYDTITHVVIYEYVVCDPNFDIVYSFPNVTHLRLRLNSKVPENIGQLKNLQSLFLGNADNDEGKLSVPVCVKNYIQFPDQILLSKKLEKLTIDNARINHLPEKLSVLKNLTACDSYNFLDFPVSILLNKKIPSLIDLRDIYSGYNNRYNRYLPEGMKYCFIGNQWRYTTEDKLISVPRNGVFQNYWKGNKPMVTGTIKNGKPDGVWKFWYENGKPWCIKYFDQGEERGTWVYWADNGDTIAIKKFSSEGFLHQYKEYQYSDTPHNYTKVIQTYSYNSTAIYTLQFTAYCVTESFYEYDNDECIRYLEFYKDDIVNAVGGYNNSNVVGSCGIRTRKDSITHLVIDVDMMYHGTVFFWYESGNIREEVTYLNNKKHGLRRVFNEDGTVQKEEYYVDGVLQQK